MTPVAGNQLEGRGRGEPLGTMTRTELLAARDQLPENGTEASTEVSSESSTCSQCRRPARAGRPTCGRPECRAKHAREAQRRRHANAKANGRARPRSRIAPTSSPANGTAAAEPTDRPEEVPSLYRTLLFAGAEVTRLDVTVAGECWTLTRSTTNGGAS
jgi:hypothetical protein